MHEYRSKRGTDLKEDLELLIDLGVGRTVAREFYDSVDGGSPET